MNFKKPFKNDINNYTLYGALFGALFPVIASIVDARHEFGSLNPASLAELHISSPLLWIIDSAPFWLGLFARLAGARQDKINTYAQGLENTVLEQTGDLLKAKQGLSDEINERMQTENALRESEARFHELFQTINAGIAVYEESENGTDFIFKDLNPAAERIDNVKREDVLGNKVTAVFPGIREFGLLDVFQRVWETGIPLSHPTSYYEDHRISGWRENHVYKLPSGEIVAIYEDVTQRKQTEEALRQSEDHFRQMSELSPFPIWICTQDGLTKYINPQFIKVLGYTMEDIPTISKWQELVYPDARSMNDAIVALKSDWGKLRHHQMTKRSVDVTCKDGSIKSFTVRSVLTTDNLVYMIFHDITRAKQMNLELQKSEMRFKELANLLPQPVFEIDLEGRFIFVNDHGFKSTGYTLEDFYGGVNAIQMFPEDQQERMLRNMEKSLHEIHFEDHEYTIIRKDGSMFPSLLYTSPILQEDKPVGLRGIVLDITVVKQAEDALRSKNLELLAAEEKLREINQHLEEKVKGRTSELQTANKLLQLEITERKKAEDKLLLTNTQLQVAIERLKTSQAQLLQSAKLAAIGELISGVAHELKNPLAAITMAAELLNHEIDIDDEKAKKHVNIVSTHAERAVSVVNNLLSFARKHEHSRDIISINKAILGSLELLAYELNRDNIDVVTELDPDLPHTMADFNQLQHVFLNLIGNADQAMHEANKKGILTIQSQQIGDSIQVSFTDNGPGIPENTLGRIFEPFFTTKEVGKGTGLGLSICYGIIEEHGGYIQAESKEGRGAMFRVELPIISDTAKYSAPEIELSGREK